MLLARCGIALGMQRLSRADLEESSAIAVVHAALDAGIRHLDTADVYAPDDASIGHSERLVARALGSWDGPASEVVVATKGGLARPGGRWRPDGRAKHLRAACEASLKRLGRSEVDLYLLHAVDPRAKLETSVRALRRLQDEGLAQRIGLCNVRVGEIERAADVAEISAVQVALSPVDLGAVRSGVAELCWCRGIELQAYSPLGGERGARRLARHPTFGAVAARMGCTPHQAALAWLRSFPVAPLPICGASRCETARESAAAADLTLDEASLRDVDEAFRAAVALRRARSERAPRSESEPRVVVFVGSPASGKSTMAEALLEEGDLRLNRDERGGRLADLLPELEGALEARRGRVILDNTYPDRASRFDVVEAAWRHGETVRCVHVETPLAQAQANAVRRMLTRHGRLLEPEELRAGSCGHANCLAPSALYRYRDRFEEPRKGEGFTRVDVAPAPPPEPSDAEAQPALFFDFDGVLTTGQARRCRGAGSPRRVCSGVSSDRRGRHSARGGHVPRRAGPGHCAVSRLRARQTARTGPRAPL